MKREGLNVLSCRSVAFGSVGVFFFFFLPPLI